MSKQKRTDSSSSASHPDAIRGSSLSGGVATHSASSGMPVEGKRRFFLMENEAVDPLSSAEGIRKPVGSTLYWVGTFDTCPRQNITLAGHTFPRFTEDVIHPEGSYKTRRYPRRGTLIWFLDEEVELIKEQVARRAVRWEGARGSVILTDIPRYRGLEGDEPLSEYVYMESVDDVSKPVNQGGLGPTWLKREPLPMTRHMKTKKV